MVVSVKGAYIQCNLYAWANSALSILHFCAFIFHSLHHIIVYYFLSPSLFLHMTYLHTCIIPYMYCHSLTFIDLHSLQDVVSLSQPTPSIPADCTGCPPSPQGKEILYCLLLGACCCDHHTCNMCTWVYRVTVGVGGEKGGGTFFPLPWDCKIWGHNR